MWTLFLASHSLLKNYLFLSPLVDFKLLEGKDHLLLSLYLLSIWHIKYIQYMFIGWTECQLPPQCEEILFLYAHTNPGPWISFLKIRVIWSQVGEWTMASINTTLEVQYTRLGSLAWSIYEPISASLSRWNPHHLSRPSSNVTSSMKPSLTLPTLLCQAHNPHRKYSFPVFSSPKHGIGDRVQIKKTFPKLLLGTRNYTR